MKILWLSHFLPYPRQGHGALQRSGNLLRYLKDHADVTLLALEKKVIQGKTENFKRELKLEFNNVEFFSDNNDLSLIGKLVSAPSPLLTSTPYSVRLYRSKNLIARAKELISQGKVDIVHVDTLGLGEELLDLQGCPIVLNHHNIESAMMHRRANRSRLAKPYFTREAQLLKNFEMEFCPRFSLNVVTSELDLLLLKKVAPSVNVAVINNSVDPVLFSSSQSFEDRSGLLFVGGMDWYPNKDAMSFFKSSIWPIVNSALPNIHATAAGFGTEFLKERESNFIGTGSVENIKNYFAAARVFVCPIREGGGTRLKLIDAMASGIPAVSTTIGAEGLKITSGDNIIIADTPEDFANAVVTLHSNPDLWQKISAGGRKLVDQEYLAESCGEQLLDAYRVLHRKQ